jgi:hypothetical protein
MWTYLAKDGMCVEKNIANKKQAKNKDNCIRYKQI